MNMNSLPTISNNEQKLVRKLNRSKYRKKNSQFIAEGERTVLQIIENGSCAVDLVLFDDQSQLWELNEWSALLSSPDFNCRQVDHRDFTELCDTDNPQGIAAVCRIPEEPDPLELATQTKKQLQTDSGVIVACDAIQDPGNLGTIIRTAVWFGAKAIMIGKGTVDPYNPKVVRSTAGTTGVLPCLTGPLDHLLPYFEEYGWHTLLLDAHADAAPISQLQLPVTVGTIIIVGNEANGIQSSLFNGDRQSIVISSPAANTRAESLNAAISLGVAFYECTRANSPE